jgi:hypothetical protein
MREAICDTRPHDEGHHTFQREGIKQEELKEKNDTTRIIK